MTSQAAVEFYDRSFRQALIGSLNLYWQARKFKLFNLKYAPDLVSSAEKSYSPVSVVEISNWENTQALVSGVAIDPNVEKIVRKLGQEAAFSVEFLLRQEAQKYGCQKNVRNIYVSDIFEFIDSSANLQVRVVTNAPLSVGDPAALIPGWVSYKFHFACGFPVKAESEYKN